MAFKSVIFFAILRCNFIFKALRIVAPQPRIVIQTHIALKINLIVSMVHPDQQIILKLIVIRLLFLSGVKPGHELVS